MSTPDADEGDEEDKEAGAAPEGKEGAAAPEAKEENVGPAAKEDAEEAP